MRFLVDAQLSPHVAQWLWARGHEADHLIDLEIADKSDIDLYRLAISTGSIIVTKDSDFFHLARSGQGAQVLWIKSGNSSTAALLQQLSTSIDEIESALRDGERVVQFDGHVPR